MRKFLQTVFIFILAFPSTGFRADCPEIDFYVKMRDRIEFKGKYLECESDWIYNLKCYIDSKLVFTSDTLSEFEYQHHVWPMTKILNHNHIQILLTVNDRPLKSKILLLTFSEYKLIKKDTLPTFDQDPIDIDSDGIIEYCGIMDYPEALDNPNKTNYEPTLVYEDNPIVGFHLDSIATINHNKRIWGKFYGFKPNYKIILTKPK